MPTKFHARQRIVHATLGLGTVIETEGDSCRVELDSDDGQRVRTFMISLGTIAPADQPAPEHPPTAQVHAQPKALEPKPEPETPTMPDALLAAMNAAITERGKGAIAGLTATLGISKNTPNNWRHLGRIPDHQRPAVQAWIDKGQILAIRVEKAMAKAKVKLMKAKALKTTAEALSIARGDKATHRPLKLRFVKRLRPDELRPSDVPPISSAIDQAVATVLQALGLTITTAWLPEGETMRQVRVAVLPC